MKKNAKISDLIPDNKNFNTGTEYGNSLIENLANKGVKEINIISKQRKNYLYFSLNNNKIKNLVN